MFKRVMVAVVGLPLLILILGWAPSWATMLLLAAMCAIGAWELMRAAAGEKAAQASVSRPSAASTVRVSPARWLPAMISLAMRVSTLAWIYRFSGRAP